jgi:guanylate kinase
MASPQASAGKPSTSSQGKLVLVIGPSGVGKSVILRALRERHPELVFPRSATTRSMRPGEGTDLYRFVSDQEFDTLIQAGKVLEWAVVHGKARYGTLEDEIVPAIRQGKIVVREVDIQGFHSIRQHSLFSGAQAPYRLHSIFILPENREQLIERIRNRAPISDEELKRRVASMDKELSDAALCDDEVINRQGALPETIRTVEEAIFS